MEVCHLFVCDDGVTGSVLCLQMVHEMTNILTETEPEQSHLHGSIGQLILIDRGLSIHSSYCYCCEGCNFIVDILLAGLQLVNPYVPADIL